MQPARRDEGTLAAGRPFTRQTSSVGSSSSNGKSTGGLQPLQQKLQQHIDREDRRIKELTEAILYDLLPCVLRAAAGGNDLPRELTPEKCRAVAGAALAVAALMNAPPGFLEFLLCVPWCVLGQMYPCPFDPSAGSWAATAGGEGTVADETAAPSFFRQQQSSTASTQGSMGSSQAGPGADPATGSNGCGASTLPAAIPRLEVSKEERAAIVNLPLDASLMDCVLGFLLRAEHAENLPPMMCMAPGDPLEDTPQAVDPTYTQRESVAALLDGATALHCAAIRGNPAQIDHLLLCGANPLATNAAGEMPVEIVPVCGDRCIGGKLSCRCMPPRDQEAWECRSRLARTLILRRCVVSWGRCGFTAWLHVVMLCLLCLLGLWGHHTSLRRPALEVQAALRRERQRQAALQRAQATLLKMRTNVSSGQELLANVGATGEGRGVSVDPGGKKERSAAGEELRGQSVDSTIGGTGATGLLEMEGEGGRRSYRLQGGSGGDARLKEPGSFDRAERAYSCFTAAVDLLQSLDLVGGVTPRGVADVGGSDSPSFSVHEQEQAGIYASWAQAALLKFRACGCSGCASLALHTAMAAHRQLARLFARLERQRGSAGSKSAKAQEPKPRLRSIAASRKASLSSISSALVGGGEGVLPTVVASDDSEALTQREGAEAGAAPALCEGDSWQYVARQLAASLHVCLCVLLETDVRKSATRAGVWRAQQCLQEWGRLRRLGLTKELGGEECLEAECLEGWCRAAAADLVLAEALRGEPVAPRQPLAEVLPLAVQYDMQTGAPSLNLPVSREVVTQLEEALAVARPYASQHVLKVAHAVAGQMQEEIVAGERLRELLQPRTGSGGGASGAALVEQLTEAIAAAEKFPNLQSELDQARGLKERWIRRAEAQAQLDAVIDDVAAPAPEGLLSKPDGAGAPMLDTEAFWVELNTRIARLEAAAEVARQANIGVSRAKRVLKELAGQGAAVEAAIRLDEALADEKAGSGAIKSSLGKAETALAGASGGAGSGCAFQLGSEMLIPRIQAARQKLEMERAAEGLSRAVASCKGVGDLPRLEAAILAARKLGAQGMHPDAYKAASDVRTRLEAASRARSSLEAALRNLQKLGRQEDVDAVEKAAEEASACGDLLAPECGRAREAVHRWRSAAASEAKLTRALREGAGTQALSRVIKEAAASGVKVGEARRLLKVMQGLEAAVQAALEGPFQYQALKSKIEAAEAGGAPPGLLASARATMQRLLLRDVRAELDAVLKAERNRTDKSVTQRLSALKAVLDKADTVLSMERDLAEQAQHEGTSGARFARSSSLTGARAMSSSAASQSLQETVDNWEDGTAASTASAPAGASEAQADALPSPRQPAGIALSRTDTAASGVTSEGMGDGYDVFVSAATSPKEPPSEVEGDQERGGQATSPEASGLDLALASSQESDLSSVFRDASEGVDEGSGTAIAAEEEAARQGSTAGSSRLPALGSHRQLPLLVVPPSSSHPASNASTPSASYSIPADSPDTDQGGEEVGAGGEDSITRNESSTAADLTSTSEDEGHDMEGEDKDDLATVERLVRRARRQLAREEAEQARIERERAKEARARREAQAERERADKERAEKAKAERAERRAAQEAAKAERRERERQQRLEKEKEREEREKAAREHFAALQRQRRQQAQLQSPQQQQQHRGQQQPAVGSSLATSPSLILSPRGRPSQHPHPAPRLPPHAVAMLDAAAQQAQHARADSLEMLSVKTGLLDLLNDYPEEGELGHAAAGAFTTARHLHSSESSLLSPSSTGTAGEAWDAAVAQQGDAMSALLGGAGTRWQSGDNAMPAMGTSLTGSEQSVGAALLSPEWSPARLAQPPGSRIRFSDLGGASWLAEGGAGPTTTTSGAGGSGAQSSDPGGIPPSSSALGLSVTGAAAATVAGGVGGPSHLPPSGGGVGLMPGGGLWGSGMDAQGGGMPGLPLPTGLGPLSTRDDLALLGHGTDASGLWQGGGGGDSWGGGFEAAAGSGAGGVLSPGRGGGGGALSPQQQARQVQLIAAIDAARAQVQLSQQAQQRVCKYFMQGFCREGPQCRYAHTLGTGVGGTGTLAGLGPLSPRIPGQAGSVLSADNAAAALSAYQASLLGASMAVGGGAGTGLPSRMHLQLPQHHQPSSLSLPTTSRGSGASAAGIVAKLGESSSGGTGVAAGGAVSSFAFGAPGSLAFSSSSSAPTSRSPTPDMRAVQTSAPLAAPLGGLLLPPLSSAQLGSAFGGGALSPFSPTRGVSGIPAGGRFGTFYSPRTAPTSSATIFPPSSAPPSTCLSDASGSTSENLGTLGGSLEPPSPRATSRGSGGGITVSDTQVSADQVGSPDREHDHYGLPSEASLFSDLLPDPVE